MILTPIKGAPAPNKRYEDMTPEEVDLYYETPRKSDGSVEFFDMNDMSKGLEILQLEKGDKIMGGNETQRGLRKNT
mgnify:CR=1 FL=1